MSDADATFLATYLFQNGPPPLCDRSADANDDDTLDNQDVIFILAYCNSGGAAPPAPGPFVCGPDPTPGALTCGSYAMAACGSGCRNQVQGDCNQDGAVDIGDVVCILGNLFLGTPALPCANGDTAHPSNTALIDIDGSFAPDISDPIALLSFLFLGGPPPSLGTGCVYIPLCPQNASCPTCVP